MENEEDEYVSIDDGELSGVDSGHHYWSSTVVPPELFDPDPPSETDEDCATLDLENGTDGPVGEEAEEEEEEPKEALSPELEHGYRILQELKADSNKSVNWLFMEAVDDSFPETEDYYDKIKSPMWMSKMDEKFRLREYKTITEFVADFRLMLENCFRYNGPDHYVSKRGQRLETMLEQKLALLSRELREKTSISATSGKSLDESLSSGLRRRVKTITPHDSSALLNYLREQEARQQREQRRQHIADRRAAQEAYLTNLQDWEDTLISAEQRRQMTAMWELPAIGHFLFLCQEALNLEEVAQYELERSFLMPRESSTMQRVMSSLLSTPFQRTKLDKRTMMPYCVWEEKLRNRLMLWYKVLTDKHHDAYKAAYKLGIDAYFFDVAGHTHPMRKKKFHELSFYRKVWIIKSLCDNSMEQQDCLRVAMEMQALEEQRSYVLGEDARGNTYMHFPQFCGADLRVYRQAPIPEPGQDSSEEEEEEEEEQSEEETTETPPAKLRKVDNTPMSKSSSRKPANKHRSSRRRGMTDLNASTEQENSPSEVSTESTATSRSMTATPELVEYIDDDVATPARRTRSGRGGTLLYQNGWTHDLERALRRVRRVKVKAEKDAERESDSEKDDVGADVDGNANNNSTTANRESVTELGRGAELRRVAELGSVDTAQVDGRSSERTRAGINGDSSGIINTENNNDDFLVVSHGKTDVKVPCGESSPGEVVAGENDRETEDKRAIQMNDDLCDDAGQGSHRPDQEHISANNSNNGAEHSGTDVSRSCESVDGTAGDDEENICKEDGKITSIKQEVVKTETDCNEVAATNGKVKQEEGEATGVKKEPKEEEPEEEDEGEELTPEIGAFEMIADNVEDLRALTQKFAEQPEPLPVNTRGKKHKPWRPPTRKRCVVALHGRLEYLLKELEPWEGKLVQARRRVQVKMRKELDEYQEDKNIDGWKTDESSSSDESDGENIRNDKLELKSKKPLPVPPSIAVDSRDSLATTVPEEEYEIDVSSRGRLRKRRVIPNNSEDSCLKKKRTVRGGEDVSSPAHTPNILQKQLKSGTGPQTTVLTSAGPQTVLTAAGLQNMSASQILRMSILGQTQDKTHGAPAVAGHLIGPRGRSTAQTSHPVIQSLLTSRQQQTAALQQQQTAAPQLQPRLLTPQSTKPQSTTLEVSGGNAPMNTQKILNALPASIIQQLLKHKAIKIQTTGPGGTTLFLTSAVPTSSHQPVARPQTSGVQLKGTSGAQLASVSGMQIASASGIQLASASGMQLASASGIQLASASASGIQLASASGMQLASASGIQLASASGVQITSGVQIAGTSGVQIAGTSAIQLGLGGTSEIQLAGTSSVQLVGAGLMQTGGHQIAGRTSGVVLACQADGLAQARLPGAMSVLQQALPHSHTVLSNTTMSSPAVQPLSIPRQQIAGKRSGVLLARIADAQAQASFSGAMSVFQQATPHPHTMLSTATMSSPAVQPLSMPLLQHRAHTVLSTTALQSPAVPRLIHPSVMSHVLPAEASVTMPSVTVSLPSHLLPPSLQIVTSPSASTPQPTPTAAASTSPSAASPSPSKTVVATSPLPVLQSSPSVGVTPTTPNQSAKNGDMNSHNVITLSPDSAAQSKKIDLAKLKNQLAGRQRYASNVTVKALLENRATLKVQDCVSSLTMKVPDVGMTPLTFTAEDEAKAQTSTVPCKVILPISSGQLMPRVVKLPSQDALDSVLQSIVKSVSTSLPTANIKVPSPVTLPAIQPRHNVTKTIQSMKAPISATHMAESSVLHRTLPSALSLSAPVLGTSLSQTQVIGAPLKAGIVVQSPSPAGNSSQKNVLMKVMPQSFMTTQGIVQGFLTPQGIVIPQNKLAAGQRTLALDASGSVLASSQRVPVSGGGTVKDAPPLAVGHLTTGRPLSTSPVSEGAGEEFHFTFSPVKSAGQPVGTPVQSAVGLRPGVISAAPSVSGLALISPGTTPVNTHAGLGQTAAAVTGSAVRGGPAAQPKVTTPAAALVKQIAAGQTNVYSSAHVQPPVAVQTSLGTGVGSMVAVPATSPILPSVIRMVGQPTAPSQHVLLPTQQVFGGAGQPVKIAGLTSVSDVTGKLPAPISGKPPTPFVLSLGGSMQNVILSPQKHPPSLAASHVPSLAMPTLAPTLAPVSTLKTSNIAKLQGPAVQLNHQVFKLAPQSVGAQPLTPNVQLAAQPAIPVSVNAAAVPKQVILTAQQLKGVTLTQGIKVMGQQAAAPGLTAILNAAPRLLQQKVSTGQLAASDPAQLRTPVLLPQHILTTNTLQAAQSLQVVVPQANANHSSVKTTPVANIVPSVIPALVNNKPVSQAAQQSTKAALQAHLNQAHLNQPKTPALVSAATSRKSVHEKAKGKINSVGLASVMSQNYAKKADPAINASPSLNASSTIGAMLANSTKVKVTPAAMSSPGADSSGTVAGDGVDSRHKLLLYNISGQLMTAQGVPVTVEQGVLKVLPQATIQIGNQMLTVKSPTSAMGDIPRTTSKLGETLAGNVSVDSKVSFPRLSTHTNLVSCTTNLLSKPITCAFAHPNCLPVINSKPDTTPAVLTPDNTASAQIQQKPDENRHGVPSVNRPLSANNARLVHNINPGNKTVTLTQSTDATSKQSQIDGGEKKIVNNVGDGRNKPVLQKSGSREEAALNLLSLANMSER